MYAEFKVYILLGHEMEVLSKKLDKNNDTVTPALTPDVEIIFQAYHNKLANFKLINGILNIYLFLHYST